MGVIVGYVGAGSALEVVLAGLRRAERPGCDAAGVAVLADGGLAAARAAGKLPELEAALNRRPLPTGGTALGHLRRGTRGAATDANAHPQLDNAGRVAVVHNGTLDDAPALRAELATRGHDLTSDTDTEAVAHLLAEAYSACGDPAEAVRQAAARLRGTFAVVAVFADAPDTLVGLRGGLPLVAGQGDGEAYLTSEPAAFDGGAWARVEGGERDLVVLARDGDEVRAEAVPR